MNKKEKESHDKDTQKSMREFQMAQSKNCSTCGCKLTEKEQKDNYHYCDDCVADHEAWVKRMERINNDICPNPSTDPCFH